MAPPQAGGSIRRVFELIREAHRLATGNDLRPEDVRAYLRDPKELTRLVKSSDALDDPVRRARLEHLVSKEESNGL
ncbi:MAG TPA: hypothetical protein VGR73_16390 [Bryobacteraceae bacterium]|nr:hypothetical protein [Bryobacteraceae bacterium]